jgi:hypothetical protein
MEIRGFYPSNPWLNNLSWQAFAGDRLHQTAEAIEFAECRVNVGRDADAFELFMHDRRREDPMLIEEITSNRRRVEPFYIHVRDRTRLIRIK